MLDSEARKVFYTADFNEDEITGKLRPEKITALKDNKINVKILATNRGKIYVVYADPLKTTHEIESKILREPTEELGHSADLEVLTLNMLYKKNF